MLELNIRKLCQERGIIHPVSTLIKAGISQGIVSKYMNGKVKRIPVAHIERLCRLLRCTPNDLFTWTPDSPADDYPENPMQAIRQKPAFNLEEKLKGMSLEEIKKKFS